MLSRLCHMARSGETHGGGSMRRSHEPTTPRSIAATPSAHDSLSASIGTAAQFTVEHSVRGKPVLRRYRASLGIETAPPTAPNEFQAPSDLEAVSASPEARLDMPGRKG